MGPVHYYDSTASTDSSGDERADSSSVTACNPGFCPLHAVGDRDTNRKPAVLPERQCGVSRVPLLVRLHRGTRTWEASGEFTPAPWQEGGRRKFLH